MRLAVFTNQFPSGVCTFFARDLRGLIDAGIEVDVFSIYPLDEGLWKYVPEILNEDVLPRNRVHHINLGQSLVGMRPWPYGRVKTFVEDLAAVGVSSASYGLKPFMKSLYVFVKAWAWAQKYANEFDHVMGYWGSYAGTCAYVFHRLANRDIPFSIFVHAGADLYHTPIYLQEKMHYAQHVITCTEFNRQYIHERFSESSHSLAEKIHVFYHGLDFSELPFNPLGRPPNKVLAVGRLDAYKGFDYLLRAAHMLARRGVIVDVEIVGDGLERKKLLSLAEELDLAERVQFLGRLPFSEVVQAMQRATVLVHPSPWLDDGLPNVIKEAMALGTPVVASDLAAIPEALNDGKCGVLVPPKNINALADAIERVLTNEPQRELQVREARAHAEQKFDLWRNGSEFAALFQSFDASNHAGFPNS